MTHTDAEEREVARRLAAEFDQQPTPKPTATGALKFLRSGLFLLGWDERSSDHQSTKRYGNRVYHLDSGYAMGQIWVKLSVRRGNNPTKVELHKWETANYSDDNINEIFGQVGDVLVAHEKQVKGN